MSFLAPFYLIAGLAVGLPILFHLIRQTPKGKQVFSSVMFLSPSPPRVTKRSRVEDWLLLLLRALAICLLALAFARPFFRSATFANTKEHQGDQIAILIDTSASMQREGLWEKAQQALSKTLQELQPEDHVSLIRFDGDIVPLISFSEWNQLTPELRISSTRKLVEKLELSWEETRLGDAMIEAAELLTNESHDASTSQRLVVISDLQAGSQWESLNGYNWSKQIPVQFVRINDNKSPTNAALQVVADEDLNDNVLRLRVSNTADATNDLFKIHWQDIFSTEKVVDSDTTTVSAYIPPGQSRVVRAPDPPTDYITQRLVLTGDQEPFDNVCYVARTKPWQVQIVYLGDNDDTQDGDNSQNSLRFFLEPVFPSTPTREVTLHDWQKDNAQPPVDQKEVTLLIVGGSLQPAQLEWIQSYSAAGGQTFFVARDPQQATQLYDLLNIPRAKVQEAEIEEYAMLMDVNLSHPVMQQFDDPRFSDFTKLKYWKHRRYALDSFPDLKLLASYEDHVPAIAELPLGNGRIILFSAGWNREESDLAVWSKFVPLMNGLLEYGSQRKYVRPQFLVGDEIYAEDFSRSESSMTLKDPRGEISLFNRDKPFTLKTPGLYKIAASEEKLSAEDTVTLAVNLPAAESETTPLELGVLKSTGIELVSPEKEIPVANAEANERQLMNQELESQQQLWKWLLLAAVVVLFLETLIAGIRTMEKQPAV